MALILGDDVGDASFWIVVSCLIVIVAVVIGFAVVAWARKSMLSSDHSSGGGFDLGDLRRLREQGKLTQAEFEKARDKIVAAAKKKAGAVPFPPAGGAGGTNRTKRPS